MTRARGQQKNHALEVHRAPSCTSVRAKYKESAGSADIARRTLERDVQGTERKLQNEKLVGPRVG